MKVSEGVRIISREDKDLVLAKLWGEWGNGLLHFLYSHVDDWELFHGLNTQIDAFKFASTHMIEKDFKPGEEFL